LDFRFLTPAGLKYFLLIVDSVTYAGYINETLAMYECAGCAFIDNNEIFGYCIVIASIQPKHGVVL